MARKSAFTVTEMKTLWSSRSVGKSKGKNDRIEKNRGGVSYYLFGNEIAFYDPERHTVTVDDAGWQSATTKDRLSALGVRVTQKDFNWYLGNRPWTGSYTFSVR
jgi:hypothetical protein